MFCQQHAGRLSVWVPRPVAAFLFNRAHVCQWQGAAQPIIVRLRQSDSWVVLMLCDSTQTGGEGEKQRTTQKLRRNFLLLRLHLCKSVSEGRRGRGRDEFIVHLGKHVDSIATVVTPWTRGPDYKSYASEHLP